MHRTMPANTPIYLDADPEQREKSIDDFLSSHTEWQNNLHNLNQLERNLHKLGSDVILTSDNVQRLLGDSSAASVNIKKDGENILTLQSISELLFRPGMKFLGSICIPSLGSAEEDDDSDENDTDEHGVNAARSNDDANAAAQQPATGSNNTTSTSTNNTESSYSNNTKPDLHAYELVILEKGIDEFGDEFVLASHSAYDDTQCVYINIKIDDAINIQYEDAETCITGSWNASSGSFNGVVRQRLQGNSGAFFTSDEVSHVFTLSPLVQTHDETNSSVKLRNQTYKSGVECVRKFSDLFKSEGLQLERGDFFLARLMAPSLIPGGSDQTNFIFKLRDSCWKDMSSICAINAEKTAHGFRHKASLLDAASFENEKDRRTFFDKWKSSGFCLRNAHSEWDQCDLACVRLARFSSINSDNLGFGILSSLVHKSHRLHQNYNILESSWKRAQLRKPTDFWAKFEVPRGEVSEDFTCIFCLVEFNSNDEKYDHLCRLPCSHYEFHRSCIEQWFHDHTSCPICRSPVTETDNETDEGN